MSTRSTERGVVWDHHGADGGGPDVHLALSRARESVAQQVRLLVEHAAQVKAKVDREMEGLNRVSETATRAVCSNVTSRRLALSCSLFVVCCAASLYLISLLTRSLHVSHCHFPSLQCRVSRPSIYHSMRT
jgi:hypothetical protein